MGLFPATDPKAPCLVFIHGGYWQRNSKEQFAKVAFEDIDLTDISAGALNQLLGLIAEGVPHILYVELGDIRPSLFMFNLGFNQGGAS